MLTRSSFLFLILMMVMALPVVAFAQDDDTADDDTMDDDTDDDAMDDDTDDDAADDDNTGDGFDGMLEFTSPSELAANQEYNFEFAVDNTTNPEIDGDHWIVLVEVFMPSPDYSVDGDLFTPDALHDGEWEAELLSDVADNPGIRWMHTGGSSSASYGDIREGESLNFAFTATSDANATDGFDWRLVSGNDDYVTGTAYINGSGDDDTADDDTDDDSNGGDDDDDDGCGC